MKLTSYTMPEQMVRRLAEESRRSGLTKSDIVRRALEAYLGREEKKRGRKAKASAN